MTVRVPSALVAVILLTVVGTAACSSNSATQAPTKAAPTKAGPTNAGPAGSAPTSAAASPESVTGVVACPGEQPPPLPAGSTRTVTIQTGKGTIAIKVEASLAPIATGNFVALAQCGFYNNVVFHRLVPGFVIQSGDGQFGRATNLDTGSVGQGGPGYTIADEPVVGDYVRGAVAMARTPAAHSQGSQFFICLVDLTGRLDKAGGYAILGHVTSGMDAVDAIAAEPNRGDSFGNLAVKPEPMTAVTVTTP
jgi:cyclophilin family peptidyl-prolyl cis-trans isomerase